MEGFGPFVVSIRVDDVEGMRVVGFGVGSGEGDGRWRDTW